MRLAVYAHGTSSRARSAKLQRVDVECAPLHAVSDERFVYTGHLPNVIPVLRQRFMHVVATANVADAADHQEESTREA